MPGLLAQHFAAFLDLDHAHLQQAADFLSSPSLGASKLQACFGDHGAELLPFQNGSSGGGSGCGGAITGSSAARGSRSCFLDGASVQETRKGHSLLEDPRTQAFPASSNVTSREQQRRAKQVAYTSFLPGMVFHAPIDFAGANSVYTLKGQTKLQSPFNAKQALQPGSGYWCSTGRHKPEDVVIWKGTMKRRKKVSGIKVSWAYAPSEVRVEVTPDGEYWDKAVDWHNVGNNVSFEEEMTFDRPRNVKAMKIEMRGPQAWNYMGINQATVVVA